MQLSPVQLRFGEAAAQLFLDTEVRWDVPYVAWEARLSGLDWVALDQLFQNHLIPALVDNLYDLAGEWAGFDSRWLAQQMPHPPAPYPPAPAGLWRLWRAVKEFYHWPRLESDWQDFRSLAHLVLEEHWRFEHHLRKLLQVSAWDVLYYQGFAPRFGPLLTAKDPSLAEIQIHLNWVERFCQWLDGLDLPKEPLLELCQKLDPLFRIAHLAEVPRGRLVLEELRPYRDKISVCLEGPLPQLYADLSCWHSNRGFLQQL